MKSDKPAPGSLLQDGKQQFDKLHRRSGEVWSMFKYSVTLENRLTSLLKKFFCEALVALYAASELIPEFPDGDTLRKCIHQLVDITYYAAIKDLASTDAPQTHDASGSGDKAKK